MLTPVKTFDQEYNEWLGKIGRGGEDMAYSLTLESHAERLKKIENSKDFHVLKKENETVAEFILKLVVSGATRNESQIYIGDNGFPYIIAY